MKYPKQIMRKTELMEMGFPEEYLMRIYRTKGQDVACKVNPSCANSPIIFDTEGLEKWRSKGK